MFVMLGEAIGFLVIYTLLALIFKHKVGFIVTSALCVLLSVSQIGLNGDFSTFFAAVIAVASIYFIVPLQIRSEKKKQWEQQKQENKHRDK